MLISIPPANCAAMTPPPRTSPSGPAVACALVLVLSVACCDAADLDVKCDSPLGCIPLWPAGHVPNETAGFPGPESRKGNDGEGCGVQHNTPCDHVYNVSVPTLTPFLVTNGTGAAVVIAPGGGYRDLAWGKEGLDVAHMYNALGVSAFVLKYRVPARPPVPGLPHWWAPLQDAQRAVGMVRAGAAKWNLDPNRIGFTGFSAGGHLTGHISTAWQERIYPRCGVGQQGRGAVAPPSAGCLLAAATPHRNIRSFVRAEWTLLTISRAARIFPFSCIRGCSSLTTKFLLGAKRTLWHRSLTTSLPTTPYHSSAR